MLCGYVRDTKPQSMAYQSPSDGMPVGVLNQKTGVWVMAFFSEDGALNLVATT
jgi:hypothetical protein